MKHSLLILLTCLAGVGTAHGHATSSSSLQLEVEERAIAATVSIEVRDLDGLLNLDANGDRLATGAEVSARQEPIADYVLSRVELRADGRHCAAEGLQAQLVGSLVVAHFTARCARPFSQLVVRDELLFEHDAEHRGFIRVGADGRSWSGVATSERREFTVERSQSSTLHNLSQHVREGVLHIWSGFDHLLFLLTLLLPSVLVRDAQTTHPAPRLGPVLLEVLKVVTAFTVAHSLTLGLSALELVRLPTRWVESLIALSVVVAGIANLWPALRMRGATMAFGFGLLHGFGFASVLSELGLPSNSVFSALLGFNVGVELGQLCIVAAFVPVVYALRRTRFYESFVLRGGSLVVIVVASLWFLERALDLTIFAPLLQAGTNTSHREPVLHVGLGLLVLSVLGAGLRLFGHLQALPKFAQPRVLASLGGAAVVLGLAVAAASAQRAIARTIEQGETERRAGQRALSERRFTAADQHFTVASGLYESAGDVAAKADVTSRLGDVALASADLQRAKQHYLRTLQLREQRDDRRGMASACHELALVAQVRGDAIEAASWLRRALELEEQLGLLPLVRRDSVRLSAVYRENEQLEAAAAALARAITLDESLGLRSELAHDLGKLAILHQLRGQLDDARQHYARAIELHDALGERVEQAKALANDATVAGMQGRPDEARAQYRRSLALFEQTGVDASAQRVRALLAKL